jgi:hypothetical protein
MDCVVLYYATALDSNSPNFGPKTFGPLERGDGVVTLEFLEENSVIDGKVTFDGPDHLIEETEFGGFSYRFDYYRVESILGQ